MYIIYIKKREEIETQKRKNMCMYATNKKPFNLNLFHSLVIVYSVIVDRVVISFVLLERDSEHTQNEERSK